MKNLSANTVSQRQRILAHLQKGLHLTTRYARTGLDIMHPAQRIIELRQEGYDIASFRRIVDGHKNVAEYVLLSNNQGLKNDHFTD